MSSHKNNNKKYKYGFYFCILLIIIGVIVAVLHMYTHQYDLPFGFNKQASGITDIGTADEDGDQTLESGNQNNSQDGNSDAGSQDGSVNSGSDMPTGMTKNQEKIYKSFIKTMKKYPECYAYIDIPDTKVSYPILQSKKGGDYNDYYLNHCIDGSEGYPGTIFTYHVNSKDFSDFNTVIYGHNMKNGSMFGSLEHYTESSYLEKHPDIYIYTQSKLYHYKIFAVVFYDDRLITKEFPEDDAKSPDNFLKSLTEVRNFNSWVSDKIKVSSDDHIITLSTCISGSPNDRFIVCGVLED